MKTILPSIASALLLAANTAVAASFGTAFTYQGRLNDGAAAANGLFDLRLTLFNTAAGGGALGPSVTNANVPVAGGLFTATADFGSVYDGTARWLEIAVRTNGAQAFTTLAPRQLLAPAPHALFASNAATLAGQAPAAFAPASGSSAYVARTGDTMSGKLFLPSDGLSVGASQLTVSGGAVGIGGAPEDAILDVEGNLHLNDYDLFFRWGSDRDHGLGYYGLAGASKPFAGINVDGPVLYGYNGGALGTHRTGLGTNVVLFWSATGRVGIGTTTPATTLDVNGPATVRGSLVVYGSVSNAVSVTRYVPITVGDLLHSTEDWTGDSTTGVVFPDGQQNGGSITFPPPSDYVPGTTFTLELYFTPSTTSSGNVSFFVRWTGYANGSWSGTGSPYVVTSVPVSNAGYIHKQSFALPALSATLPEIINLTIRRQTDDTYTGDVALTALRLSYQASR